MIDDCKLRLFVYASVLIVQIKTLTGSSKKLSKRAQELRDDNQKLSERVVSLSRSKRTVDKKLTAALNKLTEAEKTEKRLREKIAQLTKRLEESNNESRSQMLKINYRKRVISQLDVVIDEQRKKRFRLRYVELHALLFCTSIIYLCVCRASTVKAIRN